MCVCVCVCVCVCLPLPLSPSLTVRWEMAELPITAALATPTFHPSRPGHQLILGYTHTHSQREWRERAGGAGRGGGELTCSHWNPRKPVIYRSTDDHSEALAFARGGTNGGLKRARTHPQHLPSNAAKTPAPQARPGLCGAVCGGHAQRGRQAPRRCSSWSPRAADHVGSRPAQWCGKCQHPVQSSGNLFIQLIDG